MGGSRKSVRCEFAKGEASFPGGRELLRYVDMRSDPNAGGGIVGTNIRKQEQQEQGAAFALHIGPPIHEVRFLVTEADIDVPAIVSRFFGRGEPDRKCAEPIPGQPPTFTDKLVERAMQNGCVRGLAKWTLIELIEPNNGLSPAGSYPVAAHKMARASAAVSAENAASTRTKPSRTKRAISSAPSAGSSLVSMISLN